MQYDDLIKKLDGATIASFKEAVALGKWPDGKKLSREQKEHCMGAVIAWEQANGLQEEQRLGYVAPKKPKAKTPSPSDEEQIIQIKPKS